MTVNNHIWDHFPFHHFEDSAWCSVDKWNLISTWVWLHTIYRGNQSRTWMLLSLFVLRASRNGELPLPSLSAGIVRQMAGNKFQLCSSHVTLKMTYKCGLAIFLLINQSAAESKTWSYQTRICHYFWQPESHSQSNRWWYIGSHIKTRLECCIPVGAWSSRICISTLNISPEKWHVSYSKGSHRLEHSGSPHQHLFYPWKASCPHLGKRHRFGFALVWRSSTKLF